MDGVLFNRHFGTEDIDAGIDRVLESPKDIGILEMIVRRPAVNKREVMISASLDPQEGLVGDNWLTRGSSRTQNGLGHPEMQLNIMNFRFAVLIAGSRERVPLAGDQLFVDMDLSSDNLPPGTQISVGSAVIEITTVPHLGCRKFVERFGLEAMKYANSDFGRTHNLRGLNAKVIVGGEIKPANEIVVIRRACR